MKAISGLCAALISLTPSAIQAESIRDQVQSIFGQEAYSHFEIKGEMDQIELSAMLEGEKVVFVYDYDVRKLVRQSDATVDQLPVVNLTGDSGIDASSTRLVRDFDLN